MSRRNDPRPFYKYPDPNAAPPPITFLIWRNEGGPSAFRSPDSIDFDVMLRSLQRGDVVGIQPLGRCPWLTETRKRMMDEYDARGWGELYEVIPGPEVES